MNNHEPTGDSLTMPSNDWTVSADFERLKRKWNLAERHLEALAETENNAQIQEGVDALDLAKRECIALETQSEAIRDLLSRPAVTIGDLIVKLEIWLKTTAAGEADLHQFPEHEQLALQTAQQLIKWGAQRS